MSTPTMSSGPRSTLQAVSLGPPSLSQYQKEFLPVVRGLAEEFVDDSATLDEQVLRTFVERCWCCVTHHWLEWGGPDVLDFSQVIQRLQSGRLPRGQVETDLLRDVTLACSLEAGSERAAIAFESELMPHVRAIAHRVGGARAVAETENLASELILPRSSAPPRISRYQGKTSLRSWLRPVVTNYWLGLVRRKFPQSGSGIEFQEAVCPREQPPEGGCEELLRPLFAEAVDNIPVEKRLLLQMAILDGVPQVNLARLFGVDPGTISRRRQQAVRVLIQQLELAVRARNAWEEFRDCLTQVLTGEDRSLTLSVSEWMASRLRVESSQGGA